MAKRKGPFAEGFSRETQENLIRRCLHYQVNHEQTVAEVFLKNKRDEWLPLIKKLPEEYIYVGTSAKDILLTQVAAYCLSLKGRSGEEVAEVLNSLERSSGAVFRAICDLGDFLAIRGDAEDVRDMNIARNYDFTSPIDNDKDFEKCRQKFVRRLLSAVVKLSSLENANELTEDELPEIVQLFFNEATGQLIHDDLFIYDPCLATSDGISDVFFFLEHLRVIIASDKSLRKSDAQKVKSVIEDAVRDYISLSVKRLLVKYFVKGDPETEEKSIPASRPDLAFCKTGSINKSVINRQIREESDNYYILGLFSYVALAVLKYLASGRTVDAVIGDGKAMADVVSKQLEKKIEAQKAEIELLRTKLRAEEEKNADTARVEKEAALNREIKDLKHRLAAAERENAAKDKDIEDLKERLKAAQVKKPESPKQETKPRADRNKNYLFICQEQNAVARIKELFPNASFCDEKVLTTPALDKIDAVIAISKKTSHNAYETVKRRAKDAGKPFVNTKNMNIDLLLEEIAFQLGEDFYEEDHKE